MSRQILIVDDEPGILLSLKYLMEQEGYITRSSASGEEALRAVSERPPDLILLDVLMPGRDGFDICQTIRTNPGWEKTKIMFITVRGREVDIEKGLAMGADDYVTKPFSVRDLVGRVKALLG